jgi:muconolactone delta-isomerase
LIDVDPVRRASAGSGVNPCNPVKTHQEKHRKYRELSPELQTFGNLTQLWKITILDHFSIFSLLNHRTQWAILSAMLVGG